MDTKFFKDLPVEEQLKQLDAFEQGERIYALSEKDDTNVKAVVMRAIAQAHMMHVPGQAFFEVVVGIGKDDQGLYVSNILLEVANSELVQ